MSRSTALVIAIVMYGGVGCGGSSTMEADDVALPIDANGGGGSGATGEPAELVGITMFHNQIRAMVDTTALPDLVWDDSLAQTAATWAAKCVDKDGNGLVDHNDGRSDGHPFYVGENIYASTGNATAHDAVFSWAAEVADYHYADNSCASGKACGHYTQIVWHDSLKLGCALHKCAGLTFASTIVCNYGPGGNITGQKPY